MKCMYCAGEIADDAFACKHCGRAIMQSPINQSAMPPSSSSRSSHASTPDTSPLSHPQSQKWDHLAVILVTYQGKWKMTVEAEIYEGEEAWERLTQLGDEGWQLVSAVPILGEKQVSSIIELFGSSPQFVNYTYGQWLWFKRIRL